MADIIQLLPDAIANQIAAGEVIQRPASVVKELLENAIDAGGSHIKLIVKDAGKTLVQVIDNGCGMSESDARMSFERHATSKIRKAGDLFAIRTMGFRGEALASVAAVAQVELKSRLHANELGVRLQVEGSEVKKQEPCQAAPGTSISVKNLFFNVPARRNFLKSDTVEWKHIMDEFQRVALANPDIHFELFHNDAEILHLPHGKLRQRIIGILGSNANKKLVPVAEDTDILKLRGFVGKPEFAKKTRGEQFFFVNDRFIKSPYLNHAVVNAFEDLLPEGTYPLYIIFIDIDPARIDINVHPTKQEIKFDDEKLVYNYLRVAIRHALGQYSIMPTLDFEQETSFNVQPLNPVLPEADRLESGHTPTGTGSSNSSGFSSNDSAFPASERQRQANNLKNWQSLYEGLGTEEEGDDMHLSADTNEAETLTLESSWSDNEEENEAQHQEGPSRPYQIHGRYIVSHIKSGYILIDQQAAHERILYEKYLEILEEQSVSTQQQLFPKNINLSPLDTELMNAIMPDLNSMGFDIQPFGQSTYVVNGIPAEVAGKKDEQKLIEELLEQYKMGLDLRLDVKENIARSMARSACIKQGQPLSEQEMQVLIDKLFACVVPFKSPNGRNTFISFELDELAKRFES